MKRLEQGQIISPIVSCHDLSKVEVEQLSKLYSTEIPHSTVWGVFIHKHGTTIQVLGSSCRLGERELVVHDLILVNYIMGCVKNASVSSYPSVGTVWCDDKDPVASTTHGLNNRSVVDSVVPIERVVVFIPVDGAVAFTVWRYCGSADRSYQNGNQQQRERPHLKNATYTRFWAI